MTSGPPIQLIQSFSSIFEEKIKETKTNLIQKERKVKSTSTFIVCNENDSSN